MRPKVDVLGQRELALELRYHIDQARAGRGRRRNVHAVQQLIETNPNSVRSRHVVHNLGKQRLAWLREQGLATLDGDA